ncbi:MAG: RHS repeat-associated core domain-containing protein [Brevundimonas sp.]|uniref:RHS repeat-associated core domain-containing protein n=1 Tax=Brevundimonas sp. TaxID=1871086 RepID=UPI00391D768E
MIAITNAAGHATATASYSPYGEFATPGQVPPGLGAGGGVFGYTGRQFDAETGLYQYRARYYHPRLGQFLSTDPIGTKDDPNLTLYVANDPVNYTDPTGETRLLRTGVNLVRRSVRNRGNVGRAIREEAASIAGDVATLVSPDSSMADRAGAAFNLASPVRRNEMADGVAAVQRATARTPRAARREATRSHATYTRTNPQTGQVYSGRTSGRGSPEQAVAARGRSADHRRLTEEGFEPPQLDRSGSAGAIRGREQQLVEANGGAQSVGGTSANRINAVGPRNPNGPRYRRDAEREFPD